MNKKRLLAIIMTVMLIVGLLPLSTFAENESLPGAEDTVEKTDDEYKKEDPQNTLFDDDGVSTSGDIGGEHVGQRVKR